MNQDPPAAVQPGDPAPDFTLPTVHMGGEVPLAADPDLLVHRSFGLPRLGMTPEVVQVAESTRVNPTGELPQPMGALSASLELNKRDGFDMTESDVADRERHGAANTGQFLVDHDGIVRWSSVECAHEGMAGFGKFPSTEEIVVAARNL